MIKPPVIHGHQGEELQARPETPQAARELREALISCMNKNFNGKTLRKKETQLIDVDWS